MMQRRTEVPTDPQGMGNDATATNADRSAPIVVCVGETMAQLAPTPTGPLAEARQLALNFAGAESTVALYLAHLGHRAVWASRLGQDPLGFMIETALAQAGVDIRWIEHDPTLPTGVYFKDPAPEGTTVHYYRSGAAASAMSPGFLPVDLLEQAGMVHITGITPALSDSCSALTDEVFTLRETYGYTVSFDVNFRARLWGPRDASAELLALANAANIVFVGLDEAQELWGTNTPAEVRALIPKPSELIVKDGSVGATLFTPEREFFEPAHVVEVVEPVGAGDSFAAGYLHERLSGSDGQARLRTGHRFAASVLQTTADFVAPQEMSSVPKY